MIKINYFCLIFIFSVLLIFCLDKCFCKLSLKPETPQVTVGEGKAIVLKCSVEEEEEGQEKDQAEMLKWIKEGKGEINQTTDRIYFENDWNLKKLYINSIEREDVGLYTCVHSQTKERVSIEFIIFVDIYFEETPQNQTITVGQDSIVKCVAKGIPPPVISWRFKSRRIQEGPKYNLLDDGLVVRKVAKGDQGRYTCRAEVESDGRVEDFDIKVFVHYKPELIDIESRQSDFVLWEGGVVNMSCSAVSSPQPIFEWHKIVPKMNKSKNKINENKEVFVGNKTNNLTKEEGEEEEEEEKEEELIKENEVYKIIKTSWNSSTLQIKLTSSFLSSNPPSQSDLIFSSYFCSAHNYLGYVRSSYRLHRIFPPDQPEVEMVKVTPTSFQFHISSFSTFISNLKNITNKYIDDNEESNDGDDNNNSNNNNNNNKYNWKKEAVITEIRILYKVNNEEDEWKEVEYSLTPPSSTFSTLSISPSPTSSFSSFSTSSFPSSTQVNELKLTNRENISQNNYNIIQNNNEKTSDNFENNLNQLNPNNADYHGNTKLLVTIDNLLPNTTYLFLFHSINRAGVSPALSLTPLTLPPTIPDPVTPFLLYSRPRELVLAWKQPYSGGSPITHYIISYRKVDLSSRNSIEALSHWMEFMVSSSNQLTNINQSTNKINQNNNDLYDNKTFILGELESDEHYEIIILAGNKVGQSEKLSPLIAQTTHDGW